MGKNGGMLIDMLESVRVPEVTLVIVRFPVMHVKE